MSEIFTFYEKLVSFLQDKLAGNTLPVSNDTFEHTVTSYPIVSHFFLLEYQNYFPCNKQFFLQNLCYYGFLSKNGISNTSYWD